MNCGEGYLAGSALCGACARSYFPAVDGTCMACPKVDSAWARYSGLLVIVASLVGLVLVVWAALALLVVIRGGTLSGGAARMLNLGALGLQACIIVHASRLLVPVECCRSLGFDHSTSPLECSVCFNADAAASCA